VFTATLQPKGTILVIKQKSDENLLWKKFNSAASAFNFKPVVGGKMAFLVKQKHKLS